MFIWRNRWERRALAHAWSRLHTGPEKPLRRRGGAGGLSGLLQHRPGAGAGQARPRPLACQHWPSAHRRIWVPQSENRAVLGPRPDSRKWDSGERNEPPAHTAQRVSGGVLDGGEPQKLTLNTHALTHTLTHTPTCSNTCSHTHTPTCSRTHSHAKHGHFARTLTHSRTHSCAKCTHSHTLTR